MGEQIRRSGSEKEVTKARSSKETAVEGIGASHRSRAEQIIQKSALDKLKGVDIKLLSEWDVHGHLSEISREKMETTSVLLLLNMVDFEKNPFNAETLADAINIAIRRDPKAKTVQIGAADKLADPIDRELAKKLVNHWVNLDTMQGQLQMVYAGHLRTKS